MCGPPLDSKKCLNVIHNMYISLFLTDSSVHVSQAQASQWQLGDVVYSNASRILKVIAEVQVNGPL